MGKGVEYLEALPGSVAVWARVGVGVEDLPVSLGKDELPPVGVELREERLNQDMDGRSNSRFL